MKTLRGFPQWRKAPEGPFKICECYVRHSMLEWFEDLRSVHSGALP